MYQQTYKCTLLTNLVLTANSATEGFPESLDYIPGAKLLGLIAAKEYENALDKGMALDLFHTGKVHFGDAFPLVDGQAIAYRKPFSWRMPKGAKVGPIYVNDEERERLLASENIKLVNVKSGYFTSTKSIQLAQDFSIKSAYNATTLRSKEGQMYGYFSLPKGSVWTFTITAEAGNHLDFVRDKLVGQKRIGRSKSAEYGMVAIEKIQPLPAVATFEAKETAYLYAASNLCFYDAFGNSNPSPTTSDLKLPEGMHIDWKKSQIRTRSYRTWNQKRQNRNTDRLIIERGSVFAIHTGGKKLSPTTYAQGIGAHQSEGFGQVLLNPWFLNDAQSKLDIALTNYEFQGNQNVHGVRQDLSDEKVLTFVKNRSAARKQRFDIDHQVNFFRKTYGKEFADISASQWGQLRRYAKYMKVAAYQKLIFDKEVGFLYRGKMESTWRKKDRRGILESFVFGNDQQKAKVPSTLALDFMMKLSALMAKNNKNEQK